MSDDTNERPLIRTLPECAGASADLVGAKARNLARLAEAGLPVAAGFCLTTTMFRDFLDLTGAGRVVDEELAAAAAAPVTLGRRLAAIRRAVRTFDWPAELRQALDRPLAVLLANGRIVVRSSAPQEDSTQETAAGVYESVLDVADADRARQAIRDVWASLFTEKVNYYRAGRFSTAMAVVVQQSVAAGSTGVLFTQHPLTGEDGYFVEESAGPGDVTSGAHGPDGVLGVPADLARLADRAQSVIGSPIDLEFGRAGRGLVLFQARPTGRIGDPADVGDCRWAVQEDVAAVRDLPLGKCATLLMRQLIKHVPYRLVCRQLGIDLYDLYYLAYRWDALDSAALAAFTARIGDFRMTLNWGDGSVGPVSPDELRAALWQNRRRNEVAEGVSCVRVGTLIPAEFSGYAARAADDSVVVEAFPVGLARHEVDATEPARYRIGVDGLVDRSDPGAVDLEEWALHSLADMSRRLSEHLGEVRLEWYVSGGRTYVKDLSVERTSLPGGSLRMLSPGVAHGPALVIRNLADFDDPALSGQLSVVEHGDNGRIIDDSDVLTTVLQRIRVAERRPVIVAGHPSTGLIPLAPFVAGFLFDRGNLLCHLAIVLREKGVAAYVQPGAADRFQDGQPVLVGPDDDSESRITAA